MPVQNRLDVDNRPFILAGNEHAVGLTGTIEQDGGRVAPMVRHTVLARNAATGLWAPVAAATDLPMGILLADLEAAEIVAGNVVDVPILRAQAFVDEDRVVFEGAVTLDTVCTAITPNARMRDVLIDKCNLYAEQTIDITEFEN